MQKGGEDFAPASIVKLIVEVIEPYRGSILDLACGSGGMFVHSTEFVHCHHKVPGAGDQLFRRREDKRPTTSLPDEPRHGLSGDIREANSNYDNPHNTSWVGRGFTLVLL